MTPAPDLLQQKNSNADVSRLEVAFIASKYKKNILKPKYPANIKYNSFVDNENCEAIALDADNVQGPSTASADWNAQCTDGFIVTAFYSSPAVFATYESMKCCAVKAGIFVF